VADVDVDFMSRQRMLSTLLSLLLGYNGEVAIAVAADHSMKTYFSNSSGRCFYLEYSFSSVE